MDICLVVRERLEELGLEQKDLATAAEVTESYISQLLTRKKMPPAPERTDIYEKIERILKLPRGKLSQLAEIQRRDELKRHFSDPPAPLLREVRELVLEKCVPAKRSEVRGIFDKEPFGELERLVTQVLLDLSKRVAREELENENWLRLAARLSRKSYRQMRVIVLEFLDSDILTVSSRDCVSFLDPLIESWDIDLASFAMEVTLNQRLVPARLRRFAFLEMAPEQPVLEEEGFKEFLRNAALSGDATKEEIAFLRRLRFTGRRPNPLYYYRELQNLRDPLHFGGSVGERGRRHA